MSAPLLSVRGVTAYYGHVQALKGVDIDVNDGEIVALIGANGAGKSTLMMTVCGNPRARDGQIVAVRDEDGEATLKRFYRERNRIRLEPANKTMKPIFRDRVNILGILVGVVRKY